LPRLTAEQLNASAELDFQLKEEEVEIPQLGGSVLLRELTSGRRAKLMKGITDENGNINDVMEFQNRLAAASLIDPVVKTAEVRKWLHKWPATEADKILDAVNRLGGDKKKEAANAEAEFHGTDD
jgi:hypothetical protein